MSVSAWCKGGVVVLFMEKNEEKNKVKKLKQNSSNKIYIL